MFIVLWTFRLKDGMSASDFVAANERMQTEFIYQQPGCVRRTTARGEDGGWLVMDMWDSRDDAERAEALADADPVAHAADAMVDRATVNVKRFETLD